MAKKNVILFKLESSAGTGYFLVKKRNSKSQKKDKMSFNKYDPIARKHVLFAEKRMK